MDENLVAIVPYIERPMVIPLETAKWIVKNDPKNAFYQEALARVKA